MVIGSICTNAGCRGITQSNHQLPIHFSMPKSFSKSNFLFAIDKQADMDFKSTKILYFHSLKKPRDWFENCPNFEYAMLTFAKFFRVLTFFEILNDPNLLKSSFKLNRNLSNLC